MSAQHHITSDAISPQVPLKPFVRTDVPFEDMKARLGEVIAVSNHLLDDIQTKQDFVDSSVASLKAELVATQRKNTELTDQLQTLCGVITSLQEENQQLQKPSDQIRTETEQLLELFQTKCEKLKKEIALYHKQLSDTRGANEYVTSQLASKDSEIQQVQFRCDESVDAKQKEIDTIHDDYRKTVALHEKRYADAVKYYEDHTNELQNTISQKIRELADFELREQCWKGERQTTLKMLDKANSKKYEFERKSDRLETEISEINATNKRNFAVIKAQMEELQCRCCSAEYRERVFFEEVKNYRSKLEVCEKEKAQSEKKLEIAHEELERYRSLSSFVEQKKSEDVDIREDSFCPDKASGDGSQSTSTAAEVISSSIRSTLRGRIQPFTSASQIATCSKRRAHLELPKIKLLQQVNLGNNVAVTPTGDESIQTPQHQTANARNGPDRISNIIPPDETSNLPQIDDEETCDYSIEDSDPLSNSKETPPLTVKFNFKRNNDNSSSPTSTSTTSAGNTNPATNGVSSASKTIDEITDPEQSLPPTSSVPSSFCGDSSVEPLPVAALDDILPVTDYGGEVMSIDDDVIMKFEPVQDVLMKCEEETGKVEEPTSSQFLHIMDRATAEVAVNQLVCWEPAVELTRKQLTPQKTSPPTKIM